MIGVPILPKNEKVVLSVVVPVHNTPIEVLDECLVPLLAAEDSRFEVVVVDDGSNIQVESHLAKLFQQKSNANTLLRNTIAQGPNQAREKGMKACHGEYVYFVDSDDAVSINNLLLSIDELVMTNPDVLVVHARTINRFGGLEDYQFSTSSGFEINKYIINIATWWMQIFKKELFDLKEYNLYTKGSMGEDLASIVPVVTHAASRQ